MASFTKIMESIEGMRCVHVNHDEINIYDHLLYSILLQQFVFWSIQCSMLYVQCLIRYHCQLPVTKSKLIGLHPAFDIWLLLNLATSIHNRWYPLLLALFIAYRSRTRAILDVLHARSTDAFAIFLSVCLTSPSQIYTNTSTGCTHSLYIINTIQIQFIFIALLQFYAKFHSKVQNTVTAW